MTVPATARRAGPYLGTGSITALPFTFKVFEAADLVVTKTGATGIESTLELTTDYTVTLNPDQDAAPGGSVTPTVALATGETITLTTGIANEQPLDLLGGGRFSPKSVEDAFDRTVIQIQQLAEENARTLKAPVSFTGDVQLPTPLGGQVVGWNDDGTGLVNYSPSDLATVVVSGTNFYDRFSGNGVTTQFTLSGNPGNVNALDLTVGSVPQANGVDFTVSGTTLTFTSAPPVGVNNIGVRYTVALPVGTADAQNVTFTQAGTGAVPRSGQSKGRDDISAFDFLTPAQIADVQSGAMALDCTAGLQNWVNAVSKSPGRRGYAPGGKYRFTRLYGYYDASLNPGFSQGLQGRLTLTGDGQLIDAEANGWPAAGFTGTVFVSTSSTGDAFVISPAAFDVDPYPSRGFSLENLSIVAGVSGYVVRNSQSPWAKMHNVTVLQTNAAGNGVLWRSSWFTDWGNVYVSNTATTGQTGVGVDFGASLFAGSFRFSNCVFERYRDGFQVNDTVQSVALLFDGVCTFQSNARDGLQINAAIRSLVLDTPYFEFNGRSHVRCTLSSGAVQSLAVRGGFALGGTNLATSMTGPMIHLRNVTNWSVDGLAVFRPWTDIVDVGYYATNGTVGAIKNVCVDATDNNPTSDIYLARVDDQRAMPVFEGNTLIGDANVKEYDTAAYLVNSKQAGFGIESFAFSGPVQRRAMGLNGTTFLQSGSTAYLQIFNITGGGSFVALPGSPGEGRRVVIANQTASSNSMLVRQPDAVTNLATLTAGQAVICFYDTTAAKWVAVGPLAFTGL